MQKGIIGAGKIGGTAAQLFVDAGHDVAIANSLGPQTLTDLVEDLGERASAATVEDAASSAELVLVAIPFGRYGELPVEALGNRIVVDAMNYYPNCDLNRSRLRSQWRSQTTAAPPERVSDSLTNEGGAVMPKGYGLSEGIGFAPVDTGSLAEGGRRQQPGSSVYVKELRPDEARHLLGQPG